MKRITVGIIIITLMITFIGCAKKDTGVYRDKDDNTLIIYSHDSFSTNGLSGKTIPFFEELYDCRVIVESIGDVGNIIDRLIMEKENPRADIVIGIDNTMMNRILGEKVLTSYRSENLEKIRDVFYLDKTYHLTPYSYGFFAFVYDTYEIEDPPVTFGNIQDGIWKDRLIISDPRYSSTGLGLLFWTLATFGENGYHHFWRSIKNNVLTVSATWEEAYDMFLAGEAPIVLSYSTSPAFHMEVENRHRYKSFIPAEGAFMQVEGAGIVKKATNLHLAEKFIDFILTLDFQQHIPLSQWMYPVNERVILPSSFERIPIPDVILNDELNWLQITPETTDRWLARWTQIMIN